MFIREKKRRNQDGSVTVYLQLVENRRVDGKTRQRVLATLGRADDPKLASGLGSLVETASRYAQLERIRLTGQARRWCGGSCGRRRFARSCLRQD